MIQYTSIFYSALKSELHFSIPKMYNISLINISMLQQIEEDTNIEVIPKPRRKEKRKQSQLLIRESTKTIVEIPTVEEIFFEDQPHHECRICLESRSSPQNQLVSPCKCTGSVKYVHDQCYRRWIEALLDKKEEEQREEIIKNGVECELCKEKMELSFQTRYGCRTRQKVMKKMCKSQSLMVSFILFILIDSVIQGFLCYYFFKNLAKMNNSKIIFGIVLIIFVFLLIALIVTIIYFISQFFIEKTQILISYHARSRMRRNSHMIHPESQLPQGAQIPYNNNNDE